jgi:hypothetical protein
MFGTQQAYKAQAKAASQQATAAVTDMNFNFQNYEMQRQDTYDALVKEIETTRMNAMGLNATVDAAINEDTAGGGRTAELLRRSVKGDELRNIGSIKENYTRKSNEIDLNKEAVARGTKTNLTNIKDNLKTAKKAARNSMIATAINGYASGMAAKNDAVSKGLKWDFWQGAVKK